jgi:hypothetical protein
MKNTSNSLRLMMVLVLSVFAFSAAADDRDEVQTCLENWKDHPFNAAHPKFRIMSSQVKVMGMGGEAKDDVKTDKPELILVRPAVNVMSKSVMNLNNPNGWYCLKGKVAVMGKTTIRLNCKAHLTSSTSGATVMGRDDDETGVTVMGKSEVIREGC